MRTQLDHVREHTDQHDCSIKVRGESSVPCDVSECVGEASDEKLSAESAREDLLAVGALPVG